MTAPAVLLLEAAGPEAAHLTATAAARSHPVHAVTQPAEYARYDTDLRRQLAGHLLTDFTDPRRALVDIVAYGRRIGAAAALTTNEYLTVLLAHVCAALGLPGNDPRLADAARDKAAMSEALTRHQINVPRTRVVTDPADLHQLAAAGRVTFPCVVKPADAAGSAGVTVVDHSAEIYAAWRAARSPARMYGMPADPRVLVQDYVPGVEYSVESITQDGATTHLCTTAKTVTQGTHRVETSHSLPTALPAPIEQAMHAQVQRAITAVGIRNGASHTEVIVTPDGRCVVVEIGARLGAGHIGVLIGHALGIDVWAALLDTAVGRPPDLAATRREYATVRFLTSPGAGRLRAVHGLPPPGPGLPEVRLRAPLDATVEQATANRGRLGHLIVTGPNPADVEDRARQLLAGIAVEVDHPTPGPQAG